MSFLSSKRKKEKLLIDECDSHQKFISYFLSNTKEIFGNFYVKFIGFLNLDNRILPDEKTKYTISYELMRDNYGNHKIFEIKSSNLSVTHVNELLNDTSTTEITV
jgi:hypothetical protein